MNKRIIGLIGLLTLLIVIAYAAGTFDSAPSTIEVPEIDIDASSIVEITVSGSDETVRVQRTNGIWQMTEPVAWLADSVSINSFTQTLADLNLQSVVSTNPDRYVRYGVDSSSTAVNVSTGAESYTFWLASDGPDFMTSYVRTADDPRVFVGRPRLSPPNDADRWRDKSVSTIPGQILNTVRVSAPEHAFTLNRNDAGWTMDANGQTTPADSAAVSRYLQNFARLRADGFISSEISVDTPQSVVELVLSTGEAMTFTFSELETELALDYSGEPRATFRLFSSRKNTLVPTPETFQSE